MLAKRFTSFSREILAHHALKNDRLQSRVKIHTDEKALAIAFQKNPGAIGGICLCMLTVLGCLFLLR